MNTFKRFAALVLAMIMTFTMLCACGKIEETPDDGLISGDAIVSDVPEVTEDPATTTEATTTTPEVTTTEPTTTEPEVTTTEPTATEEVTTTEDPNAFTVEEMEDTTMYATISLNVRSGPSVNFDKIDTLKEGEAVTVTGRASTGWYQVLVDGKVGYVSNVYITDEAPEVSDDDEGVVVDDEENVEVSDDDVTVVPDDSNTVSSATNIAWVEDNGWGYMYNALYKDEYRSILDQIMNGISNYQTMINVDHSLTSSEWEDFSNFFFPIMTVEYSYVYKINRDKNNDNRVIISYYVGTAKQGEKMVTELRSAADKVVSNLKSSWTDYQKIQYLHDWLVKNCRADEHSYDITLEQFADEWGETLWPNSAYGAIVDGQPTCLGYAKGMFYLLSRAGYEVSFAEGIGESALHIWVKVKVDGKWYNIDPTWDDPYGAAQNADPDYIAYTYFMVTDEYIKETHAEVYDIKYFADPSCTSTKYDWYRVNDCYVTSYDEVEALLKKLAKAAANSNGDIEYVTIRMSSDSLFEKVDSAWTGSKFKSLLENYTDDYDTVKKGKVTKARVITFRLYKD